MLVLVHSVIRGKEIKLRTYLEAPASLEISFLCGIYYKYQEYVGGYIYKISRQKSIYNDSEAFKSCSQDWVQVIQVDVVE